MSSSPIAPESKDKKKKFEDYEIEGFARTLMDAEEIKANPEKLKLAQKIVCEKMKAIKKVHMSLEDMKQKGADMPMDEEGYMHEAKKGDKKEDKTEGEEIS